MGKKRLELDLESLWELRWAVEVRIQGFGDRDQYDPCVCNIKSNLYIAMESEGPYGWF